MKIEEQVKWFSKYEDKANFKKKADKYNETIRELEVLMKEYKEKLAEPLASNGQKLFNKSKTLTASEIFSKAYRKYKTHCLAPYQYKNGYGEAFAKLVQIDSLMDGDGSDGIKIHLALMTPQMLFTDYYFYCRNAYWVEDLDSGNYAVLDELYKPYYYAFNLYEGTDFDKVILDKLKKRGVNGDYCWFNIEIMSDKNENSSSVLEGELCFAASTEECQNACIKIKSEIRDPQLLTVIESVDFKADAKSLSKDLSKINFLSNSAIRADSEIVVYNVGQANCIYIYLRDGQGRLKRIFFDIGKPIKIIKDNNTKKYRKNTDLSSGTAISGNLNNIGSCKPDLIILSHWHYDHVRAILNLGRYAYEDSRCQWLAQVPHAEALEEYKRIINYLVVRDRITWIDDSNAPRGGSVINQTDVKLYRGKGLNDNQPNEYSLLLMLKNTLLSGDCMYQFWPDAIQKDIDQINTLIVPHHASKLTQEDKNVISKISKGSRKEAVICAGQNHYGHPAQEHKNSLKADWGFTNIIVTGDDVSKYKYIIRIS